VDQVNAASWQRWAGIGLIAATGAIHLIETPEYYGEVRYIGLLFALSMIGALASAIGIARGERWGWQLGLLIAGGSLVSYLLSRTVGMPGLRENTWEEFAEPMGLLSLVLEGLFVAGAANVLWGRSTARTARA
jgi:hypothetical protein